MIGVPIGEIEGNLISELSEERIVILSTHIVSDVEYIANEIWLMKKSSNGISSFGRMDNLYNVRFDKMLQNSYLNGEYGATPIFETEEEISKLFSTFK